LSGPAAAGDERPPWLSVLHPWSGGLLLLVDNLCFGGEVMTGMLALPVVVFLAFSTVFLGVYRIQRRRAGNGRLASLAKALVCGMLAGVPWSIAGTAVGGLVLLLSGLSGGSRK
jgi:hypothetical protein